MCSDSGTTGNPLDQPQRGSAQHGGPLGSARRPGAPSPVHRRRGDRRARRVRPWRGGGDHHADQILSFYEHYDLPDADSLVYRDAHAAQNLRWWHEYTGDKIAYWGASAHTANAPQLRFVAPSEPEMRFPSAGSYLREWYGQRYLSIGFTFDHGTVSLGPGETVPMPAPAEDRSEKPLGTVRVEQLTLDLRTPAPPPVQRWLEAPIRTRGLPDRGPDSSLDGGSLGQWFDVIVHRQQVTPVQPTAS